MKLGYAMITYKEDYNDTLECLRASVPYVDTIVLLEDGSYTKEDLDTFKGISGSKLTIITLPFEDNYIEYSKVFTDGAKRQGVEWLVITCPDEHICPKLWEDLRTLVDMAEREGADYLYVNSRDQFDPMEWIDDPYLIRQYPKEPVVTSYYKDLIVKLYPDFTFGADGKLPTCHGWWQSPTHQRYPIKLDSNLYYYIHRKTTLWVWRTAAKNLFLCAGGDNVGDSNRLWVELREICSKEGIKDWKAFEGVIKRGKVSPELLEWFKKALQAEPSRREGIETRDTSKFYFALHRDEITPEIRVLLDTLPTPSPESDIRKYVKKCYEEVLNRPAETAGLENYVTLITEGKISKEELPKILKNSSEYRQLTQLENSIIVFKPNIASDSVAVCIMGYEGGSKWIKESIRNCKLYVDEIHVQGDDFTPETVKEMEDMGAKIHILPWNDQFSDYKNKCLSWASTRWVLILDHDEIPTPIMAMGLRTLVKNSDKESRYNMVGFKSLSQVIDLEGKVIEENIGDGKANFHLNIKNPYYSTPHIWLKKGYYPWKIMRCSLFYLHKKEIGEELIRSVRNVFCGGGGDSMMEKNPYWKPLQVITKELGVPIYRDFIKYLDGGNVDIRVKDLMEGMFNMPCKGEEDVQDIKIYYVLKHPEEAWGRDIYSEPRTKIWVDKLKRWKVEL